MKSLLLLCAAAMFVASSGTAAQQDIVRRNQSGSINYAPRPAVYEVVAVDTYERVLQLRERSGAIVDVRVPEDVFDLSTLKPGDRLRVDFLVPNEGDPQRAAATVWPVR